jgi:CAAX protease family protein
MVRAVAIRRPPRPAARHQGVGLSVRLRPATTVPARRAPLAFVALVFALSIPFWVLGALVRGSGLPGGLPLSALQFLAPLGAAVILVARREGWAAVARTVRRAVAFGSIRPRALYLPILLLLPAIYATSYLVMVALGRPVPAPQISIVSVAVLAVLFLVSSLAEETGWTGYATDPLRDRWGLVRAAVVLGVAWALVHVVPDIEGGREIGWIAWHRLASVALRVLIVWAYDATGGAIAAAVLLHATDDVSWASFPVEGSHYDPAIVAPLIVAAATVVAVRWSGRGGGRVSGSAPAAA